MFKKAGLIVIVILSVILWVFYGPSGVDEISEDEFTEQLFTQKDLLVKDLDLIIDKLNSSCGRLIDIEYHVNQNKLIVKKCDVDISNLKEGQLVLHFMKKWRIKYVVSNGNSVIFDFLKTNGRGKIIPEDIKIVYHKSNNSNGEVLKKIGSNYSIIKQ